MTATSTITEVIRVRGIHCEGCENAIRTALCRMDGVNAVAPSAAEGNVRVSFDEHRTGATTIRQRLAELGYDPADDTSGGEDTAAPAPAGDRQRAPAAPGR